MSGRTLRHRLAWWAASRPASPARPVPLDLAPLAAVLRRILLLALGVAALAGAALAVPALLPALPVGSPPMRSAALARSTHVFAADGSLIATLHGEIDREPIPLGQMPRHLQLAAVAAEDARFFRHRGLDLRAIARAASTDLMAGRLVEGGSTITQQYVKDAYVGSERSLGRKLREAVIARRLERRMSKRQILEAYLNTVYFGRGAYGVEAAARTYFGKAASDLTVSESALLVGLIRAPARSSPYTDHTLADPRRRWVIGRMRRLGFLNPDQADLAIREQPRLSPIEQPAEPYPWFMDALRRYLFFRYGAEKVLTGGLEVRTTIDPQLQRAADQSLAQALPAPGDPHAALVSIEPETGYVRALVGGRDSEAERYNIAIQGRRQPGSAFKPFVLVAALEHGMTARSGVAGTTLEQATVHSINAAYMRLVRAVGPQSVVEVARRLGVPGPSWIPQQVGCRPTGSDICRTWIQPVPALALGSEEVTPLEMASAFSTLADHGNYREPKLVSRVVDATGRVLEEGASTSTQAVAPSVADQATEILKGVITRGTGRRASIGRPAAGKTGTSQDYSNAWFIGYTPELATAVWVGYRDANRPLVDVEGVRRVAGGTIPADIWRAYMSLSDLSVAASSGPASMLLGGDATMRFRVENRGPWPDAEVVAHLSVPPRVRVVSATAERGGCAAARNGVSCRLGELARGEAVEITTTLHPTTEGTMTMGAAVTGAGTDAEPGNELASIDQRVDPAADLSLSKNTLPRRILVGQEVTYALTIRNAGPSPATEIVLGDPLPDGVGFVAARGPGDCADLAGRLTCRIDRLRPGAATRIIVVGRAARDGRVVNAARVSAAEADPDLANNAASAEATIDPVADLSVSQQVSSDRVLQGQELTLVIVVTNHGPSSASGVTLTDRLPGGAELVAARPAQGSCAPVQGIVACSLGDLPYGGSIATELVIRPTQPRRALNRASVRARETDPERRNDEATSALSVVRAADLSVAGSVVPDVLPAGEELAYTLAVTNAGPSASRGVTLTAQLPPGASLVRVSSRRCAAFGQQLSCRLQPLPAGGTGTLTVTIRATLAGPAPLKVSVAARDPDPEPRNNQAELTATVVAPPSPEPLSGSAGQRGPGPRPPPWQPKVE